MSNFFNESANISKLASIDISLKGTHTYIGAFCVVDDFVKIKHVGGAADIRIGNYVFLNSGTIIYSGNGVEIGDNVLIGPNCNIVPVNHAFICKSKIIREQGFMPSKGGIIIEDDVWIGAGVTILDGAHIKKGSVIGAGSIVKAQTEEYSINLGNPLKQIGLRK